MTNHDAMPGAENFADAFTAVQRKEDGAWNTPHKRVSCVWLYRRYLAHACQYGLPLATKAQFAAAMHNAKGVLPTLMATGGGQTNYFFDRVIFTGSPMHLATKDPRVLELLMEISPLDVGEIKGPSGTDRRARNHRK